MTVAELVAKLQEMPQDMEVFRHGDDQEDQYPVSGANIEAIGEILFDKKSGHYQKVNLYDVVMLS